MRSLHTASVRPHTSNRFLAPQKSIGPRSGGGATATMCARSFACRTQPHGAQPALTQRAAGITNNETERIRYLGSDRNWLKTRQLVCVVIAFYSILRLPIAPSERESIHLRAKQKENSKRFSVSKTDRFPLSISVRSRVQRDRNRHSRAPDIFPTIKKRSRSAESRA